MTVNTKTPAAREDLQHAIEEALWSYPPVRSRDLPMDVDLLEDGRVRLSGYAPTLTIKEGVLEIVSSVPGVAEVEDRVHADPNLEIAVAQALTTDDRTSHIPPGDVRLFAQLGVVVVVGRVPNQNDRHAAVEVAREVAGVRQVIDRMSDKPIGNP